MMVLTTSLRFDFKQVAPWAWKVSNELTAPPRLRMLALRTAMRFGAAGADEMWTQQFRTATEVVDQTRLALLALELSPWMRPELYQPMRQSTDTLIARMGDAGEAVAQRQQVAQAVEALIALHHAMANDWALDHASQYATHSDAIRILHALIRAFEQEGSPRTRARRLDHAVGAAKVLAEKDIDQAVELLRPIITAADTDAALVQGVLLGLIGSKAAHPDRVVAGVERLAHPTANRMAVFLTARHNDKSLAKTQLEDLALLVRGGGGVPDTLRIQAAWTYLKITGQTELALQQALAG
jgi:hypothetical protein